MTKISTLKPRITTLNIATCERLQYPTTWQGNNAEKRIFKGRNLQRERDRLFNSNPLCVECEKQGRDTVATIRDHIIPLAEWNGTGSPEDRSNIQGLCVSCHNKKTNTEARRGKKRNDKNKSNSYHR